MGNDVTQDPVNNDPPPVPPTPPDDDACCGQGCNPCVLDLYAEALERYRAALREWQDRQANRKAGQKQPGSSQQFKV